MWSHTFESIDIILPFKWSLWGKGYGTKLLCPGLLIDLCKWTAMYTDVMSCYTNADGGQVSGEYYNWLRILKG